jgi:ubiquinone/menaquinone biosynthesis C-methylase UbiE
MSAESDTQFVGSIPEIYERLLVPLIFAEPARRLAETVAASGPADVLETAAGTGVVTRALRERLPTATITATDLNESMLVTARRQPGTDGVRWQQADAMHLDFADASFDAVVCQFGVMFFPDRVAGYAEARRVLRPGGVFAVGVWDSLDVNDFPRVIVDALSAAAGEQPLEFFRRTPYGYFDRHQLTDDFAQAGFTAVVEECEGVSTGTAADVAVAFCQGTPMRNEIEAHPDLDVDSATGIARDALVTAYGTGPVSTPMRWLQVTAT